MSANTQISLIDLYTKRLDAQFADIDSQAIQILKRLKDARFEAYLVGGGVRDLLVNLKPKDFDIATNALPQEVKRKVPHCFIIGRRFKLVHAKRGESIYEIATFRRAATIEELETTEVEERHLVEENFFGNIQEDSFRRDFTINSLYYDPIDGKIVDHCNGLQDIYDGILRVIGKPKERLIEDPIRILRAIRLSQKLKFNIEVELRTEISNLTAELQRSPLPRRREEWLKFFRLPNVDIALMELFDLKVFSYILPTFHQLFENEEQRQVFLDGIRKLDYFGFDLSNPTELFCGVLASYIKAVHPDLQNVEPLADNPKFVQFCKDELGVFKAEAAIFFQAMKIINPLKHPEVFLKKGERRQRSLVFHANFDLALKLALLTDQLTVADFAFWIQQKERLSKNSTNSNEPISS